MIEYKLIKGSRDYEKARRFYSSQGVEHGKLSFPTVLALEEDEIVGALSTRAKEKKRGMIVAGPFAIKKDRPRFMTVVRIVEAYDAVMHAAGVKSYLFFVPEGDTRWLDFIDRAYGIEPYARAQGHLFFVKRLQ